VSTIREAKTSSLGVYGNKEESNEKFVVSVY